MAEMLQEVENELNCSICLDTYTDPKMLQYFHEYCRKCLVKLVVRDQQGQLTLTCPICRQVTPIPANGVAGLQPAFHLNHFLEIVEKHKKAPADPAVGAEPQEERESTPHDQMKLSCSEHEGKEMELYCDTCGELICYKCAVKGGKHHSHNFEELDRAFEKYKAEITASLEPMEKQLTSVNKILAQFDASRGTITDQLGTVEADIYHTFRKIEATLSARKTQLIGQLHQITERKLKSLAAQRDQLETLQARLGSCLGFMRESCKSSRQGQVLKAKRNIDKQVKELTSPVPSDLLQPQTEADVQFVTSSDLTTLCQNYGQVSALGAPDPSKCHATGKGTELAVVGETSTAAMQAVNCMEQPCVEPIQSSEIELVSEITGTSTRGSIERRGQSQYEISYYPTIKGRHQLRIKVEGQHIRGSPFSVAAKLPVEKLGTPIQVLGDLKQPYGVTINQRGELVVTERGSHCVSVFSPSGERLHSFGKPGSGQGQFRGPGEVVVDGEGNILVADSNNHRIQKFTAEGEFLTAVGTRGSRRLQFNCVVGITSADKVYVTEFNNHRVQILNSDLTFSSTFGKYGSGKGQFNSPLGVACDSAGNVYVADRENHRIQVFSAEGKFLRMFGQCGRGRGNLHSPVFIAIDSSDMVYVSEWRNHRVSVFTSAGVFVTSFGGRGEQPGQFHLPFGVAVDKSGVVYVCDGDNCHIQMF